jgi:hypothetical protein
MQYDGVPNLIGIAYSKASGPIGNLAYSYDGAGRMAEENQDWGYRRIQGALSNLGTSLLAAPSPRFCSVTALSQRPSGTGRRHGRSFCRAIGNSSCLLIFLPWKHGPGADCRGSSS